MNRYLSKLIWFSIQISILYLTLLLLIIILNKKRDVSCELNVDTHALIVGDSHVMWGINDKYIDGAQNISQNAEGYFYTYAKLKHMLNKKNNVKEVILGYSFHNISGYFDDYIFGERAQYFISRYISILDLDDYLILIKKKPKNILKLGRVIIIEGIPNFLSDGCAFIGSFPEEKKQETINQESLKNRIEEQFYIDGKVYPYSEFNIYYFDKIVKLCKSYNVDLKMLNTPLSDSYEKLIPEIYVNKYNELLEKYRLKVFDFNDFYIPDSCFLPDGDHLNYNGSIKASMKLNDYLKQRNVN